MNPYTQLLTEVRQRLLANDDLAPIPLIIEHEGRAVAIATRSKTGHVATLLTTNPHGLKTDGTARIELMSDDTYNVEEAVITVVDATTFTYGCVGPDEAATAEADGIVTPLLVPIDAALSFSLAKGGLLRGATDKGGMAILLMTPRGIASGNRNGVGGGSRTLTNQTTTVRTALFVRPILNASANGLRKEPLNVHYTIMQQLLSWNRGMGQAPVALNLWDSRENPDGELSYYADFEIPQLINL